MPHNALAANEQMLIRKPVEQVFEAFVDPATTTKFWLTKSSGRQQQHERIRKWNSVRFQLA